MLRLQSFPDSFKINVAYTQVRKIAGNSVTVKVIELIAKQIKKAIEEQKPLTTSRQLELDIKVPINE